MKRKILVDASYLFALHDEKDSTYKKAVEIRERTKIQDIEYVLGMNVYSEILTLVSQRIGKADALMLISSLNSHYTLINPNEDTYIRADSYFKKVGSKNISYSDCISFAIMDEENISQVLSFDDHFKLMGFVRVGIDDTK